MVAGQPKGMTIIAGCHMQGKKKISINVTELPQTVYRTLSIQAMQSMRLWRMAGAGR